MANPSRIALARRRRGFTKRRLADAVGVTDRSLTGFESGGIEPAISTVERIAEVLAFPAEFFSGVDLEEVPEGAASFRSLSKMTASQRNAALAAGTLALALTDWIVGQFRLPNADIPTLGPGLDPETAADVVRAEWGIGEAPIPNIIHLLEMHGVRVFSLAEESRAVDAFSFWRGDSPYVFLNAQKSAEHSRFDAAHELAHLVLHSHHEIPQGRQIEREAQTFASAFLMPRAATLSTAPPFPTLTNVMPAKRHWRVSVAAYIYRLHTLGVLSDWHYRTLNVELSKRGYRTKEPNGIQRETSQVLNKVFNVLRKEGIGKAAVADALRVYPADLDALVFGLAILPLEGEGESTKRKSTAAAPGLRLVHGG